MKGLFAELYLDEDVDVLVADLVRARGFAVITTQEAGNLGASDKQQLAAAVGLQSTLLTDNRADFEVLAQEYFAAGEEHYGIIIANTSFSPRNRGSVGGRKRVGAGDRPVGVCTVRPDAGRSPNVEGGVIK